MRILIDFLSLRPVWTRRGLEIIWYAYLVATLIQIGLFVGFIYSAVGAVGGSYHLSLIAPILFALAHLTLVRIFLELALRFLINPSEEAPAARI
jgi:uncharacterized membrane protein